MDNLKSQEYFRHRPISTQYVVDYISTIPRLRWHTIRKTFRDFQTLTYRPELLRRVSEA